MQDNTTEADKRSAESLILRLVLRRAPEKTGMLRKLPTRTAEKNDAGSRGASGLLARMGKNVTRGIGVGGGFKERLFVLACGRVEWWSVSPKTGKKLKKKGSVVLGPGCKVRLVPKSEAPNGGENVLELQTLAPTGFGVGSADDDGKVGKGDGSGKRNGRHDDDDDDSAADSLVLQAYTREEMLQWAGALWRAVGMASGGEDEEFEGQREEAVQQAFLAHRKAATLTMRNKSNRATGATVQVADKEARAVACAREADEALAEVITASLASKKR